MFAAVSVPEMVGVNEPFVTGLEHAGQSGGAMDCGYRATLTVGNASICNSYSRVDSAPWLKPSLSGPADRGGRHQNPAWRAVHRWSRDEG
jgi:hypothetical protein